MNHETEISVRFCETDMAGHVNNTSYFIYLEEARGKFFDQVIPDDPEIREGFILASTNCDFLGQSYFNQRLVVMTRISKIGTKSFSFNQIIRAAETGAMIAEAEATIVCFDYEAQKTVPITPALRNVLEGLLVTS
ncbi:acyl-CoA thioesterase [Pseudalkalibacillus sp. A8]|uniref:acyl-CoA thioesterase n=1 Tax=Pseudalkalibacillus sp. A8 TaxID=3382641 RepID=UPI0038B4A326